MNKKIEYVLGVMLSIILPLATFFLILYLPKKSNPNQISNNIITTVSPFLMPTTTMMPVTTQIPNKQISTRQMSGEQMPPGQMPPGQMPPGQMPPGQMPPGQMPLATFEDLPTAIKNILVEIEQSQAMSKQGQSQATPEQGQSQATPEQLERLEKAVQNTIVEYKTTALNIVNDAKNAPKDSSGQPILDKKILSLFGLMLMLFMGSEGKYFKNEIGPEIEKSYGSMPQK